MWLQNLGDSTFQKVYRGVPNVEIRVFQYRSKYDYTTYNYVMSDISISIHLFIVSLKMLSCRNMRDCIIQKRPIKTPNKTNK